MTATATPTSAEPRPDGPGDARHEAHRARGSGQRGPGVPGPGGQQLDAGVSATALVAAEVALLVLTLTAVLGLARIVDDGAFLLPVVTCTLGAHALGAFGRRRGLPAWVVGLAGTVGLLVLLGLVHVPETTAWGLPTGDTLDELRRQLADAGRTFAEAEPPAPLQPGYVVAWAAAAWVVGLTADAAAFRARATFESIIPAGALFVFASALGSSRYQVPATAAFLAAALMTWLTQRMLGRSASGRWVGVDRGRGLRAIAGPGAWLAVGGVLVAALVGPHLPGAGSEGAIRWNTRPGDGPSNRITVSPLVDIRTRLVEQSTAEVFTVTSSVRSYWRLTALDTFDGVVWSSNNRYSSIGGVLDGPKEAPNARTVRADQTFQIAALATSWLPAAYRAFSVRGIDARYHAGSSTLLADDDTQEGQTYRVVSEVPIMTGADLANASRRAPQAIVTADTLLPADFPTRVTELARQIVSDARTPYLAAKRLQDYFRGGTFTYDLGVGKGESQRALERFLFDTKRGYCEQFAGAFAAMARAVGLPSRVAVGFTPGEQTGVDTYRVLGLHGHAWPEVYLDGFGWVAFEPTPGRGIPNGEGYTGIQDAQASIGDLTTTTTVPDDPAATTVPTTEDTLPEVAESSGGGGASEHVRFIDRARPFLVALALLPFAWLLGLTVVRRVIRDRRRRAARDPGDRVLVAWREAMAALHVVGMPRQPAETPVEFAGRVGESGLASPVAMAELAHATTLAVYAGHPLDEAVGRRAVELADAIGAQARATVSRRRRIKALFDPRTLLPTPTRPLDDRDHRRRELERVGS